jgi:hypothetical protein
MKAIKREDNAWEILSGVRVGRKVQSALASARLFGRGNPVLPVQLAPNVQLLSRSRSYCIVFAGLLRHTIPSLSDAAIEV